MFRTLILASSMLSPAFGVGSGLPAPQLRDRKRQADSRQTCSRRIRLRGGNRSPELSWSGGAGRHKELCRDDVRFRRADRQRRRRIFAGGTGSWSIFPATSTNSTATQAGKMAAIFRQALHRVGPILLVLVTAALARRLVIWLTIITSSGRFLSID